MSAARERLLIVLALLALGGIVVLASTQTFSTVALTGIRRPLVVAGSQAAPALAPLGLAQLALAGALTIAGRIARLVLGVVLVVLGGAVVALVLPVVLDPASGTAGPISTATGVTGAEALAGSVTGSGWPLVALVVGALGALLGVVVLLRSRAWTTGGRRYRQPADTGVASTDPIAEWDALTRGGDPTEDTAPPERTP